MVNPLLPVEAREMEERMAREEVRGELVCLENVNHLESRGVYHLPNF